MNVHWFDDVITPQEREVVDEGLRLIDHAVALFELYFPTLIENLAFIETA